MRLSMSQLARLDMLARAIANSTKSIALYFDFKTISREGDPADHIGTYKGPWETEWLRAQILSDIEAHAACHPQRLNTNR